MIRGEGKYKADYTLIDIYKQYVKDSYIKQFKSAFAESTQVVLPYKTYKKLIDTFFKKVIDFILEESGTYHMPLRFGELKVRKKKMPIGKLVEYKKLKLDYNIYNKTGKKVYHLNEHRNGFRYSITWDKKSAGPIVYKGVYKYIPTRKMNRRLAQILKTDFSKDYFE